MFVEHEQVIFQLEAREKYRHAQGARDSLLLYLEAFMDLEEVFKDEPEIKYELFLTPDFLKGVNRILFGLWMDLYH